MFGAFDARQADEGRSFLSKKGGGNRLGEKLFDEQVNVWADPWNPEVPVLPWDSASMLARHRTDVIKGGQIARSTTRVSGLQTGTAGVWPSWQYDHGRWRQVRRS
jgi:predicted Zn-dependent protease